ncbi:MAG: EAL domain-containing protein, partial [Gammaproteobacteria bacterium]|nr:EAL domain-containing protein [Gammaproteobacteria bacterium]
STILAMAHNLALHVVAEGIETDAQQARLQALGCPGAQGFLYARPMPLEGLAEHFRTRRWSSNDAQHAQC